MPPGAAPTRLESFEPFGRLPAELRWDIWKKAMETPRVVCISPRRANTTSTTSLPQGRCLTIDGDRYEQVPATFFVNREARMLALERYRTRLSLTHVGGSGSSGGILPGLPGSGSNAVKHHRQHQQQHQNQKKQHYLVAAADDVVHFPEEYVEDHGALRLAGGAGALRHLALSKRAPTRGSRQFAAQARRFSPLRGGSTETTTTTTTKMSWLADADTDADRDGNLPSVGVAAAESGPYMSRLLIMELEAYLWTTTFGFLSVLATFDDKKNDKNDNNNNSNNKDKKDAAGEPWASDPPPTLYSLVPASSATGQPEESEFENEKKEEMKKEEEEQQQQQRRKEDPPHPQPQQQPKPKPKQPEPLASPRDLDYERFRGLRALPDIEAMIQRAIDGGDWGDRGEPPAAPDMFKAVLRGARMVYLEMPACVDVGVGVGVDRGGSGS
ncbi:hypothetical protein GGR56DRAFT_87814 [Xylariaceae sp. FL0804]|nr:hypothetical protein GGR56DRAFT_87814 [Xylariaceae sp. FL0804]